MSIALDGSPDGSGGGDGGSGSGNGGGGGGTTGVPEPHGIATLMLGLLMLGTTRWLVRAKAL